MKKYVFAKNFGVGKDQVLIGTEYDKNIHGDKDKLEARGLLVEADEYYANNKPSLSKVEALEARIKELENQEINTSDEKVTLELEAVKAEKEKVTLELEAVKAEKEKVTLELEAVKAEKEKVFSAGESMAKQIEELVAMLKESISLPKGQEPTGYKKYKG